MSTKLDIFAVLEQLNKKNVRFFDELSEDHQKQLQPFLIMKWASGTSDDLQIAMLNECVNPYAHTLYKHKRLLWELLTISSSGTRQRYKWNKAVKQDERPLSNECVQRYYGYSEQHVTEALKILGVDDVVEIAEMLGYQKKEIDEIEKEWK